MLSAIVMILAGFIVIGLIIVAIVEMKSAAM